jgi:hypothetical protein
LRADQDVSKGLKDQCRRYVGCRSFDVHMKVTREVR